MPELPEVETVRRTLRPLIGHTVSSVYYSGKPLHMARKVNARKLRSAAIGHRVTAVRRWGKYLLIDFSGNTPRSVVVHLGMSGRLRLASADSPRPPHTHVVFELDGKTELRYSDPRRFGQVDAVRQGKERDHAGLARLGVDPFDAGFSGDYLHHHVKRSKREIKTFLLDQKAVSGVGNIYASEALWRAGIRPTTRANRLSLGRTRSLADAIVFVLNHALQKGGTSLRDFVAADGQEGANAPYLRVYGRDGSSCPNRCGGTIRRCVQQGRASFYCPRCQRT